MATDDEIRMAAENLDLRRLLVEAGIVAEEHEASERLQRLLLEEVHHRVKNVLATVMAITSQSLMAADSLQHGREAVEQRLLALARVQDLLLQTNWTRAPLATVVDAAISPFESKSANRFRLELVDIAIIASAILPISLILHELITNAIKYGALSNEIGHVEINATVDPQAQHFRLTWVEVGGPPVAIPTRRSFGLKLVERGLVRQLGGTAELRFDPAGVRCSIDIPLSEILPKGN